MLATPTLLFILLAALTAPLSFARDAGGGGDTLGNGGGLAELQITKLWSQLDRELAICQSDSNPCSLSSDNSLWVKKVIELKRGQTTGLVFFAETGSEIFRISPQGITEMNSRLLYLANGAPKPVNVLLQYVLASFLVRLGQPLPRSLERAGAMAGFLKQQLFRQQGFVSGKPASLVLSQIARPAQAVTVNLYSEFDGEAKDLTEAFLAAFPCQVKESSVKILSGLFRATGTKMSVEGGLQFECREEPGSYQADYAVAVSTNPAKEETYVDLANIRR